MSNLTLVLMIVGAFILVLGIVMDVRAHLEIAVKNWRLSAIISEPNTTATSCGKAPGAMARTPLPVELALIPSTWVITALPSAIQEAAAQSGGIATGIDPAVIHPATIDRLAPAFSYRPFNSAVCNSAQHSCARPPMIEECRFLPVWEASPFTLCYCGNPA